MDYLATIESDHFEPLPGRERKAGFEFEYTGIHIQECAELLADKLEGNVRRPSSTECLVENSVVGKIRIESDWNLIQKISNLDKNQLPQPLSEIIDMGLKQFSEIPTLWIPWEIITEPISYEQLHHLETMRETLLAHKAHGTSAHFAYAFGTHINCEVPSSDVEILLNYLRAFMVLYPLLLAILKVSPTRRLLTFIDHFPEKYTKLVLNPKYKPDLHEFITDYVKYNKTRNRALDLLPIFLHYEPKLTKNLYPDCPQLVKARPTFHYRLPNSDFGNPDWRVAKVWNSWVSIEKLANDSELPVLCEKQMEKIKEPLWLKLKSPISEFKEFFHLSE